MITEARSQKPEASPIDPVDDGDSVPVVTSAEFERRRVLKMRELSKVACWKVTGRSIAEARRKRKRMERRNVPRPKAAFKLLCAFFGDRRPGVAEVIAAAAVMLDVRLDEMRQPVRDVRYRAQVAKVAAAGYLRRFCRLSYPEIAAHLWPGGSHSSAMKACEVVGVRRRWKSPAKRKDRAA